MKKLLSIFMASFLLCLVSTVQADNEKNIKLAIFDNLEKDNTILEISQGQETAYMQGIKAAINFAKSKNMNIKIKTFFYENGLLDFMQQMPKVKAWQPDAVIGLHTSSSMLMSKQFSTDKLVLSVGASSSDLLKLPASFYSLATPDLDSTRELVDFISRKYPNRNLLNIVGAESKQPLNYAALIASVYKKINPKILIKESHFLSDDVNFVNISALVKDYQPGDIIVLSSMSGTYNDKILLMNKIADYLAPQKLTFLIPFDNWNGRALPTHINDATNPYTAYRLDAIHLDTDNQEYKDFVRNFEKLYHHKPTTYISYITYRAVLSIVNAIQEYPAPANLATQQAVLWSYQQALKHNPNWFRPISLAMYKLETDKEVLFEKISLNKNR